MAEKIPSSLKPAIGLTAQQWAWQFLRRNPQYQAAFELLSTLSWEQYAQLKFLIAQCQNLLVSENFLDEKVIRTLDLRFFESKHLEMIDEVDAETVGDYLERTCKIPGLDKKIVLKVSKNFWLETYCLADWVDPVRCLDIDSDTAGKLWRYTPFVELGLASAPWLEMIEGVNLDDFQPRKRSSRGSAYEAKAAMLRGADGALFLRSATVWGPDYITPTLGACEVDVRFDLSLPLAFQLKQAQELMEQQLKQLRDAKILEKPLSQVDGRGLFSEYLLILDSLKNGGTPKSLVLELNEDIVEKRVRGQRSKRGGAQKPPKTVLFNPANLLHGHEEITSPVRTKMVRAIKYRDHGYKALAFL